MIEIVCDVVVDADFARCLLGVDNYGKQIPESNGYDVFKMFFDRLGKVPVFSAYVFEHELCALGEWVRSILDELKNESYIKVYGFADLSIDIDNPDNSGWKYYDLVFRKMYKSINFSNFPDNENVFHYKNTGCSLGEIHSILLAQEKGFDFFCSNDNGSKIIVKNVLVGSLIKVITITDGLLELKHNGKEMPRKECKLILCNLAPKTQELYYRSR